VSLMQKLEKSIASVMRISKKLSMSCCGDKKLIKHYCNSLKFVLVCLYQTL
jgi:hypothetical protein